jgi:hypothetical protein
VVEGKMFSRCFTEEDKIKYGCETEREIKKRNKKGNSKEISVP